MKKGATDDSERREESLAPTEDEDYKDDALIKLIPSRYINIYTFTLLLCLVQFWYSFYLAYTIAALTTLERRYGMPSLYSGIFLASFEIGHLTIIVFSFTETNCHIPRRLALRSLFMAIGAFLITTPHILVPVHSKASLPSFDVTQNNSWPLTCTSPNATCDHSSVSTVSPPVDDDNSSSSDTIWAVFIMALAQCIVSTASSTYCVIGVLYIDNNVDKDKSSAFIGTVFSMMMLGPAAAFFFSSGVAGSIYVEPMLEHAPDPNSSHFVGAWWSGFLLSSLMFLIVTPFFLLFPSKFEKRKAKIPDPAQASLLSDSKDSSLKTAASLLIGGSDEPNEPFTLQTLPRNFIVLFKNTSFLALIFVACSQMYITSGYFTFYPKYIEAKFMQPVWVANLLSGISNPIPCALGTFLGGILMATLKLSQSRTLLCTMILVATVSIGLLFMTGLECDPDNIIGLHSGAISSEPKCSEHCTECPNVFEPICGSDGRTYASPCHAGCQVFDNEEQIYRNCICIDFQNGTAIAEKCQPESFSDRFCPSLVAYNVMAFILAILIILPSTPMTIIMMRCVGARYKSWAIGITSSFCSILSFIPAPLIFGTLFDSHCLLWNDKNLPNEINAQPQCSNDEAKSQQNCILYETKSLGLWFHLLTSAFLLISLPVCFYLHISNSKLSTYSVV